jgi:hypothetical protein
MSFGDVGEFIGIAVAAFSATAAVYTLWQRFLESKTTAAVKEAEKRAYASGPPGSAIGSLNDRKSLDLPALLDLYSKQIAKYQVETRFRAEWSFVFAVVAMAGGLALLLFGAWHIFNGGGSDAVPASAVTIVGAAVSGFIAKTFLDVHQTSLIQLNHYFKQPVLNSHILTAQRLMELLTPGDAQQGAIKDIIKGVLLLIPAEQAQSAVLSAADTKRLNLADSLLKKSGKKDPESKKEAGTPILGKVS